MVIQDRTVSCNVTLQLERKRNTGISMRRTKIEVAMSDHGWVVTRESFGRDSTHRTKAAAIKRGVKLAREKQPSELIIRRADGSIQDTRSYGTDIKRILKQ